MEVWKQIPEHPEYQVSNLGNVLKVTAKGVEPITQRWINSGKRGGVYMGFKVHHKEKLPSGFAKTTTIKTHIIVARLFIGPRPEGMVTMHLNDDKSNNTEANLKYGTQKENVALARRNKVLRSTPT